MNPPVKYEASYYERNKEAVKAKRKAHYWANRDRLLEEHRRYREAHKEEVAAKHHEWYVANKAKVIEATRKLREAKGRKQSERDREYAKEYRLLDASIARDVRSNYRQRLGVIPPDDVVQTHVVIIKIKRLIKERKA